MLLRYRYIAKGRGSSPPNLAVLDSSGILLNFC